MIITFYVVFQNTVNNTSANKLKNKFLKIFSDENDVRESITFIYFINAQNNKFVLKIRFYN